MISELGLAEILSITGLVAASSVEDEGSGKAVVAVELRLTDSWHPKVPQSKGMARKLRRTTYGFAQQFEDLVRTMDANLVCGPVAGMNRQVAEVLRVRIYVY